MPTRPTLLNSCASATSAAEARYRIDAPLHTARSTRVVALDEAAANVIGELADQPWRGARFLSYDAATHPLGAGSELADVVLVAPDGSQVLLSEELAGADFVMMIATADAGASAASAIGDACTLRGIMTAGLILGEGREVGAAVSALRPHARVLLVSNDRQDAAEVLSAVGS